MDVRALEEKIATCKRCELHRCRTMTVPGEGPPSAEIMLIGEAPGADEDIQGRPFVGRAGGVLNRALKAAGIDRSQVFITNVVKCRPPENRRPKRGEIEACRPYLEEQIRLLDPKVICLLGNVPTQTLLGRQGVTALHGSVEGRFLVTFHPAAVVRNRNLEEFLISDLLKVRELL